MEKIYLFSETTLKTTEDGDFEVVSRRKRLLPATRSKKAMLDQIDEFNELRFQQLESDNVSYKYESKHFSEPLKNGSVYSGHLEVKKEDCTVCYNCVVEEVDFIDK